MFEMAAVPGIAPRLSGPEPDALLLRHTALKLTVYEKASIGIQRPNEYGHFIKQILE
jgi:hypothetical protein